MLHDIAGAIAASAGRPAAGFKCGAERTDNGAEDHRAAAAGEGPTACRPAARRRRLAAMPNSLPHRRHAVLVLALLLGGCEMLGIDSPEKLARLKEAEGKAVGSACRHALRAIEDCYALNPKAPKSSVFGGWREMDEYMRENKLEGVSPVLARLPPRGAMSADEGEAAADRPAHRAAEPASDRIRTGPAAIRKTS